MTGRPSRKAPVRRPSAVLRTARWPEDLPEVRARFEEYRQWLAEHGDPAPSSRPRVAEGLALVDELLGALPGAYRPPRGDVLLWYEDDALVACGALRTLAPGVGEIRRIFVRADYRGGEFGRPFMEALIARAGALGLDRVHSDTLSTMTGAIEFHEELGFRRVPAHWPHPAAAAVFFEREVDPPPGPARARRSKAARPGGGPGRDGRLRAGT